jgi:hypothetical protein
MKVSLRFIPILSLYMKYIDTRQNDNKGASSQQHGLTSATTGRGLGIVGVNLLVLYLKESRLPIGNFLPIHADPSQVKISHGHVPVRRKHLHPTAWVVSMAVGHGHGADFDEFEAGVRFKLKIHILDLHTVHVGGDLNHTGPGKGQTSQLNVTQRAQPETEVIVTASFEIGLVVELKLANIGYIPNKGVVG